MMLALGMGYQGNCCINSILFMSINKKQQNKTKSQPMRAKKYVYRHNKCTLVLVLSKQVTKTIYFIDKISEKLKFKLT